MGFRQWLYGLFFVLGILGGTVSAQAQDVVTLRVHHFLPATSTTHQKFLKPWARTIEEESQGRLRVRIYPAMQLGGKPPQLYDQVVDGVVDIIWTLPGYTPGRFPRSEVLELPFMSNQSAEDNSIVAEQMVRGALAPDYRDVHVLMLHAHGAGSLHVNSDPYQKFDGFRKKLLRAPTRQLGLYFDAIGAITIGMPAPEVAEKIARGIIDGTALPFEVTDALKINELVEGHVLFPEGRGLYTALFLFAMNKKSYQSLPLELQQVLDQNTGINLARKIGKIWDQAEADSFDKAMALGNQISKIDPTSDPRWFEISAEIQADWIAEKQAENIDGQALVTEANKLLDRQKILRELSE